MPRVIAAALWITGAGCCLGLITDGLGERRPFKAIAGIAVLMMLAAVWLARAAWKHSERYADLAEQRDRQARALESENRELHEANCALVRAFGRASGVVTKPFHVVR